jgi:hypothetical protein
MHQMSSSALRHARWVWKPDAGLTVRTIYPARVHARREQKYRPLQAIKLVCTHPPGPDERDVSGTSLIGHAIGSLLPLRAIRDSKQRRRALRKNSTSPIARENIFIGVAPLRREKCRKEAGAATNEDLVARPVDNGRQS